jgi:integrase
MQASQEVGQVKLDEVIPMSSKARASVPTRQRTGTVEPFVRADGTVYYRGKVRLADGSRERIDIDEPHCFDEAAARAFVRETQAQEDVHGRLLARKRGTPPLATSETVREWCKHWRVSREARGNTTTRDDASRLEHHAFPTLAERPIAAVTRDEVEAIVEKLDAKVRAGDLSWHTAWNVWAVVSRMFRDATNAKQRDLRVRGDNPARDVAPPDRGARKGKVYLYPSEFLSLVSCELVPLVWRRIIALAAYTFPRAGELEALEWADVDVQRGIVHVHRGTDRQRGGTKGTKTGTARRFAVEPAVLPLLRAMHAEAKDDGHVAPTGRVLPWMPRHRDLAEGLRTYLEVAGVTRAELHTTDATRKAMTFHDLRATGLTWLAIRGDDPLKIKQRAGHSSFATTEGYIREAEAVRDAFGEVFPPLPSSLLPSAPTTELGPLRSTIGPRRRDLERLKRGVSRRYGAGWTGLEPAASGVTGRRYNQLNYHPRNSLRPPLVHFSSPPILRFPHPWAGQGLNLRRPACKASALPLSYPPHSSSRE